MFNFNLPNLQDVNNVGESQKVKSYLYQLTEQLRYVLNNIDVDNFSADIRKQYENAVTTAESLAKLEDFVDNKLNKTDGSINTITQTIIENEEMLQDNLESLTNTLKAQADSIETINTSKLEKNDETLMSVYEQVDTLTADTATLTANTKSQWLQTASQMLAIFNTKYDVESYDEETMFEKQKEFAASFQTYIRFSDEGIEIGKKSSVDDEVNDETKTYIVARLSNNKLAFVQPGSTPALDYEVAYISDKKLFITEAQILNRLVIGSESVVNYIWTSSPEYGLVLKAKGVK